MITRGAGMYSDSYAYSYRDGAYDRPRRMRREGQHRSDFEDRVDANLGSVKMKIPPFGAMDNPSAYLAWEREVQSIFLCHNYSEEKKVKLASAKFSEYATHWLNQFNVVRKDSGACPINTWEDLKMLMRRRCVPTNFHRNLHQGNKNKISLEYLAERDEEREWQDRYYEERESRRRCYDEHSGADRQPQELYGEDRKWRVTSVFEAERPGCRFSAKQRIATYFYKGVLYGSVGFGCGLIGQGIANLIMTAKRSAIAYFLAFSIIRSMKKSEERIPIPPLFQSAALWGVFLAVSSNTRYQIINGLERVVEGSAMAKQVPPVAMAFTVGVRFANNIYSGMQFVDWAKLSGVQ